MEGRTNSSYRGCIVSPVHLFLRRVGKSTYVYLRSKGRANGHVVNTANIYLGTQADIR